MQDTRTRIQRIWHNMKTRCTNPNYDKYKYYGGKGISVCDEWMNSFKSFEAWAHEHGYSDDLTLERINVDGNYEPSNCRWATRKDQANNRKSNHMLEFNGQTKSIADWARETGLSEGCIGQRIRSGWDVDRALTEKHHDTNKHRLITFNGKTQRLFEWAKEIGISLTALQKRLDLRHWSIEDALTIPLGGRRAL